MEKRDEINDMNARLNNLESALDHLKKKVEKNSFLLITIGTDMKIIDNEIYKEIDKLKAKIND